MFADPDFDGYAAQIMEETADDAAQVVEPEHVIEFDQPQNDQFPPIEPGQPEVLNNPALDERRKFYVGGGRVEIAAHLAYELDADGNNLRMAQFSD
jgi:type I restriction enzyme, R subunit